MLLPQPRHHACERRVQSGADDDGRDDDEEVLDHEIVQVVWVAGAAQPEDVADQLEQDADQHERAKGPVPMQVGPYDVQHKAHGEEGDGGDGKGHGRGVAACSSAIGLGNGVGSSVPIYDDRDVILSPWIGYVGVDVASRRWSCHCHGGI